MINLRHVLSELRYRRFTLIFAQNVQRTIVVGTHELESAFRIADRITVLDRGKILITGSVDEVRNCEHGRVQDLLNRRFEEEELDPDAYLERLTGGAP